MGIKDNGDGSGRDRRDFFQDNFPSFFFNTNLWFVYDGHGGRLDALEVRDDGLEDEVALRLVPLDLHDAVVQPLSRRPRVVEYISKFYVLFIDYFLSFLFFNDVYNFLSETQ